ncbi:exopolysaccharide biosynthesis protein [Bacteroidia bacterium]|nr:exopolysaccharide biosynthesis protein [Bacteroidia bacterium]
MNVKILVCAHKNAAIWSNEVYMPIQMGRAISGETLDMQGDDDGDNISLKNKSYCELTGLYWAWKNLHDVDYVGLCHYRRYFDFREHLLKKDKYFVGASLFKKLQSQIPDFQKIFSKYDMIITEPEVSSYNLAERYSISHNGLDLEVLKSVVSDVSPEFIDAYEKVMNNNKLSAYNMFITRKSVFDDYCSWLFKVLGEVEKRVNISSYNHYQARIYAFMAERLLPIYIERNKLRAKAVPIIFNDENKRPGQQNFLFKMKKNLCFYAIHSHFYK